MFLKKMKLFNEIICLYIDKSEIIFLRFNTLTVAPEIGKGL